MNRLYLFPAFLSACLCVYTQAVFAAWNPGTGKGVFYDSAAETLVLHKVTLLPNGGDFSNVVLDFSLQGHWRLRGTNITDTYVTTLLAAKPADEPAAYYDADRGLLFIPSFTFINDNNKIYNGTALELSAAGSWRLLGLSTTPEAQGLLIPAMNAVNITIPADGAGAYQAVMDNYQALASDQLQISYPEIAENGAVVPLSVIFSGTGTVSPGTLWFFISSNPAAAVAKVRFHHAPYPGSAVSLRVKIKSAGDFVAAYVGDDGSVLVNSGAIKVTIGGIADGSGAVNIPATTCDTCAAVLPGSGDIRTRFSLPGADGRVEFRLLISHAMDLDNYLRELDFSSAGTPLVSLYWTPYIAKNPYLALFFPAEGDLSLRITNNGGASADFVLR